MMAMNDDYRLVLSGDSSDLENSLKAIELYMDSLESKNIDAPLDNFLKKLKVIAKEVKNVQNAMDKQDGKSVISSKDMDESIKSTQSATKNINELKKALDDLQKENISKGIAPDPEVEKAYAKMGKVVDETQEKLEKMSSQKIGSDASIQNRIKEMKTLNQVTEEYNKISKDSSATKDYTKRLRANRNMTRGYMERSEGTGRLTYDQGARVRSELGRVSTYESQRNQNQRDLKQAREQYTNYGNQQQDLTKRRANGQINKAQYEQELASIKQEMKAREELISNYEKLGAELDKTIQYYKGSVQQEFSSRKVDQQRGTFGRMIEERLPSIGSHAGMAMTGAMTGLYMKGASLSESNRPMVTSLGQNSDNMDIDSVRNAYGNMSIDNKLGYNSNDMLKMATSYEASVGHKSDEDTMAGTKQLAIGGRSLGIQDQGMYQESMNQIMHTGGVNSDNMKEMQDAFLGGIKQSGMIGRQDEQLKALGSIAEQSGEGRTLTKDQMSNLTAMQSTFAESGSKGLQGEQGANAINSIDQGLKNGMNSSYARISMGWGTQYQGLEGGYDLQKRMDEGISNPENLTDMADMATQMGGSEKEQKYLFNRSMKEIGANLTMEQSDEIFKDAQSGKLSKEELAKKAKKMEKEGSKEGEDNATDYKESKSGKNDQNKSKTDDKAEDTYDMAQPIRDAHSAMASLPTPVYAVVSALGVFSASLLASAGQFGLGRAVGKGKGWFDKKRNGGKSGGGTPPPGTSPGRQKYANNPKTPNGGGTSGGSRVGSMFEKAKSFGGEALAGGMMLGDKLLGGKNKKGGTRSGKEQFKGAWDSTKKTGKGLFDHLNPKNRDFTMGDYLGRTKDFGKKSGKGLSSFGKETFSESILNPKNFKGLGGKIKDGTGSLLSKGKGAYGKFADKFGDGGKNGILSQSPKAGGSGIGKLGKLAGGLGKGAGVLGVATSALSLIPALASGDSKAIGGGIGSMGGGMAGASAGASIGALFGGVGAIPGALIGGAIGSFGGGAVGEKVGDMAKKANTKEGWNLGWTNGDKDGKNKFQDSLLGKPISKAWNGITGLFDNDAEASEEDSKDKKKGVKGVKGDTKKKEKMTAEQLREKNNQSETKNLKIYSDLLDRAQKIIESAKGINIDGGTSDSGSNSGGSASDVGGEGAEKMYKFLKGKGLSDNQVGAVMGNLQQESNLDPNAKNASSGAFGIAQWLGARKTGLENFAKSKGKKSSDMDVQLDYLWKEMQSDYESNNLKNAGWSKGGSLEQNTKAFATGFERMGANEAMMGTRVNNAKEFKKKYGGSGGGGGGGALSSTYQEAMSNPVLTTGSNYRGSNDASNASTTNRITVNVNVQGGNNPEETGDIIGGRIREVLDSNMDIFANEHKRSY
ncbi:tail tape measure [Staphylococcus phage vB_Sau_CG]|nr:tail tape measure [Staphylococcus phage vB_Sau_CG]